MFDSNEMFQWIENIVDIGIRRPGSPGDKKSEDYVFSFFESLNLNKVYRQAIPITYWDAEKFSIRCGEEDSDLPCFYMPYTKFTPDDGVRGNLIYVADASLEVLKSIDLEGKVVVFDLYFPMLKMPDMRKLSLAVHDPENLMPSGDIHEATWIRPSWYIYEEAVRQGAAGAIGILRNQPGGLNSYYAPYGFREKNILDKPIPGFWVGKNDAEVLVNKAKAGESACLSLTGICEETETHNVIGHIQGESDETIIIATHHDAPFDNAVEDGSGMAVVMALAKKLANEKPPLKRSLLFVVTAGHFYGSIGTIQYIRENRKFVEKNVVAEIHIEHVAKEVEEIDGKLELTGRPEPAAIFTNFNKPSVEMMMECLNDAQLGSTMILPAHGPLGNYPPTDGGDFYEAGIPIFNYICNPTYLLCNADTLEMVDKNRLAPVATAFYKLIQKLQHIPKSELRKTHYPLKRLIAWWATRSISRKG